MQYESKLCDDFCKTGASVRQKPEGNNALGVTCG